jgi:hypothetical protein
MKLLTGIRVGLGAVAALLVATALLPNLSGQQLSLSEANAICGARFNNSFQKNAQVAASEDHAALQQQRQKNQSKVAVGMTWGDVLQLLGPPDHAGAAWLDSAETHCIWSYDAIRQPVANGSPTSHDLKVTMSLDRKVVAVQFQESAFRSVDALGKTEH